MSKQAQNNPILQQQPSGIAGLSFFSLMLLLTLSQNADWSSNGMLWWGGVAIFAVAFFINDKGTLYLEKNFTIWLIAFSGLCLLSILWALKSALVLSSMKSMVVQVFVLLFVRSAMCSRKDVEQVLKIVLFSSLINIVWLLLNNQEMFSASSGENEIIDRLGTEGAWNANSIGMMAATAMLIALYFCKKEQNLLLRGVYTGAILLTVLVVLLTGSRKALLMVVMGFGGLLFLSAKGKRFRAIFVIAIAVLILYYLVMEVPFFYSIIGWRVEGLFASLTGAGKVDSSTQTREAFVQDGIRAWKERPLLGYGLDCYRNVNLIKPGMYAHNNYVELLADLGIVGVVTYYIAYIYSLIGLLRKKHKDLLVWVLFIMLIIQAVMDYGSVSYNSLTTKLTLLLSFALLSFREIDNTEGA